MFCCYRVDKIFLWIQVNVYLKEERFFDSIGTTSYVCSTNRINQNSYFSKNPEVHTTQYNTINNYLVFYFDFSLNAIVQMTINSFY